MDQNTVGLLKKNYENFLINNTKAYVEPKVTQAKYLTVNKKTLQKHMLS